MLSFDVSVTGSQVASALANDVEECSEMLATLADQIAKDDMKELCEMMRNRLGSDRRLIRDFAQQLIDACR